MKKTIVILAGLLLAGQALAHDYEVQGVKVGHPWSRPAPKGGSGAGFATFTNTGRDAVTLIGVKSAAAASAGVHQTVQQNGVFSMKAVSSLPIGPGQTVTFAPGGYHVMFAGLKAQLGPGGKLPATLTFRRGDRTIPVEVTFNVDAPKPEAAHKH